MEWVGDDDDNYDAAGIRGGGLKVRAFFMRITNIHTR